MEFIVLGFTLSWIVIVVLLGILGFVIKQKNDILEKLEDSNRLFHSLLFTISRKLYMVREEYSNEVLEILKSYQKKHYEETGKEAQFSGNILDESQSVEDERDDELQNEDVKEKAEGDNVLYLKDYCK